MKIKLEAANFSWRFLSVVGVSLALCAAVPTLAHAEDVPNAGEIASDLIAFDIGDASVLNEEAMLEDRGSGGVITTVAVTSEQTLGASSSSNSVNVNGNMTNGSITAGENFGGSGFGSFVLNSGNNATINSGVSLSVLMMPQAAATP